MYRYSSTLIFFFCTSEQIPMRLDTEQKLIRFNVAIGKKPTAKPHFRLTQKSRI